MAETTLWAALRALDNPPHPMTMHGFRAMARTILDEVLGFRPDIIEHQVAHAVRDPNGRAYNRTAFLPERRQMMQEWAHYLDRIMKETAYGLAAQGAVGPTRPASNREVERVTAYAKDMNAFLRKSRLMDTDELIWSFVKKIPETPTPNLPQPLQPVAPGVMRSG